MEGVSQEAIDYYMDPRRESPIDEMNDPRFREYMAQNWLVPNGNEVSKEAKRRLKRDRLIKKIIITTGTIIITGAAAFVTGGAASGAAAAALGSALGATLNFVDDAINNKEDEKLAQKEVEENARRIRQLLDELRRPPQPPESWFLH